MRSILPGVLCCLGLSACDRAPHEADPPPAALGPSIVEPIVACDTLVDVDVTAIGGEGSRITSARRSDYGGIPVCEVEGTLAPSIGIKVVLPIDTWRQRYLQVGCGGLCGNISLRAGAAAGCLPLARGDFVIASSDMGHQGQGGDFGNDPQKRIDFAYRGMHATAAAAKALITKYYGRAEAYAYFSGCSDGGREALMEAQRYPEDFDGIIAGAPAMNFSVQNSFYHAWQAASNTDARGRPIIAANRLNILYDGAMAACDALDGLTDELIVDPRACRFDPTSVRCADDAHAGQCLTATEAQAASQLYDGPRDSPTGLPLTLGGPQPGSELSWEGVFVPSQNSDRIFSAIIARDALGNLIYEENPAAPYSLDRLRFDASAFDEIRPLNGLYSSTDPDLASFEAAGGKLILWHGWSDPHISPINTIAYFEAVEGLFGAQRTASFARLFLFPGVYHCSGGTGPSNFDMLTAMVEWVELGSAPDAVVANREDDGWTRPVYPYPLVAEYSGNGSIHDGSNFAPREGARGPSNYEWAGKDFLVPGYRLDCRAVDGDLVCTTEN